MWEKQWDYLLIPSIVLSGSIWEFTEEWFEGKRFAEQGFESRAINIFAKYCNLQESLWVFHDNWVSIQVAL